MKKNKIVVVFSSHLSEDENNKFINHVKKTIGVNHETHCYPNFNERSLPEIYNEAIDNYSSEDTIMVFCHNDMTFETRNWGRKLLNHFNNEGNDYGILGVAGTSYLPDTGRWWDDRSKMIGVVNHTDGIKTWTSYYSSMFKGIREAIIVDGLFIAVNTDKITHKFDTDFGKFHFYDIPFCYSNYLDGVDVGVISDILVTHQSVGQTNQSWEDNRVKFVEKYGSELPYKHVTEYGDLKVLITCLSFREFTGSELYVYELAKELKNQGCDVTILSGTVGNPLKNKATKLGIDVREFNKAPNYIFTDNKFHFMNNEKDFDIIHLNHKPVAEQALMMYPNIPAVMHIHSEVIPKLEEPVINERIKKYFSIRPSIDEYIKSFGIPEDKIERIVNPIDTNRFNTDYEFKPNEKEVVLFVGTLDYLRQQTLIDLKRKTKENNQELWVIGKNIGGYLELLLSEEHVKYFGVVEKVEDYVKKCDYTAGILLGRTTLEGYFCGKKGWIYDVDTQGNILSKNLTDIPENIQDYSLTNVVSKIKNTYEGVLKIN